MGHRLSIFFFALMASSLSRGNTVKDPVLPISHCYHWLKPEYLEPKYEYAKTHENEMSFYTEPSTSNGSQAGPGLYCAKSPSQSKRYGTRLIRIDLVEDVVVFYRYKSKNVCGHRGDAFDGTDCQNRTPDMILYDDNYEFFVIKNPAAIASWSSASHQLIADLEAESRVARDYSFEEQANSAIKMMKDEMTARGREVIFYNGRSRLSAADFLVRDPERIQSMRSGQLLTSLAITPAGRVPTERMDWARRIGIEKLAKEKNTAWADIRVAVERDLETRRAVVAMFPQLLANPSPPWDLLINIAAETGEEIGRANLRQLAAALAKDPVATKLWDQKVLLRGPLADEVKSLLLEWAGRANPAESMKEFIQLYQYAKSFIDLPTANRLLEFARRALPPPSEDGFELSWSGKSFPVGSPETFAKACLAQALINELKSSVGLTFGGRNLIPLNFQGAPSPQSVCETAAVFAKQYLTLKKSKGGDIQIVTLNFDRKNLFYIPVDEPATLERFATELFQNNNFAASREILIKLNDGRYKMVFFNKPSPRHIALFSRCVGLRSPAEKAFDETIKNRPDAFEVNILMQTHDGGMTCFDMALNGVEETLGQCEAATKAYPSDLITVAGFTFPKSGTNQFYVDESTRAPRDRAQVCAKIREKIAPWVPTASVIDQMRKASSMKFRFFAYVDGEVLALAGNHTGEIQTQCIATMGRVKHSRLEDVEIRTWPGLERTRVYRERDNWQTTAGFCGSLLKRLAGDFRIPSAAQYATLQLKKKYRAEVEMGYQKLTLIFDNKQEMYNQCLTIAVNEEVDRITWTLGPSWDRVDHPSANGSWKTKQETCWMLFSKVKLP